MVMRRMFPTKRKEVAEDCKSCIMKKSVICILHYYQDNQIQDNEMCGVCSIQGRTETFTKGIRFKIWRKETTSETST
jgi:hypothetical protein